MLLIIIVLICIINHISYASETNWGTYRPNLYVGMKAKQNDSPLFGILWYDPNMPESLNKIRHECQEGDGLSKYGWLQHDGKQYGIQELNDPFIGVNIISEYLQNENSWIININGKLNNPSLRRNISLIWYVSHENGVNIKKKSLIIKGKAEKPVNKFQIHGKIDDNSRLIYPKRFNPLNERIETLDKPYIWGLKLPKTHIWDIKPKITEALIQHLNTQYNTFREKLHAENRIGADGKPQFTQQDIAAIRSCVANIPNQIEKQSNVIMVQHFLEIPFKMKFSLLNNNNNNNEINNEKELKKHHEQEFRQRFEKTFPMKVKPKIREFAMAAMSNLIGGIGHFYGASIVNNKLTEPQTLVSAVPSRSFFPRGFLWDEGFHNLIISRWDINIGLDIMKHWFDLCDKNGWIAREQILGEEARSRVPENFRNQDPNVANPPTLIMALLNIIKRVEKLTDTKSNDSIQLLKFAKHIYPRLKRHVQWYIRTQASHVSFAWQGRTLDHNLASGLDDYPRATFLNQGQEGHVDLHCWMIMLHDCMVHLSKYLAENTEDMDEIVLYHKEAEQFEIKKIELTKKLSELYWNNEKNMFSDYIVNPNTTQIEFVNNVGYVTFFPLMLRILKVDDPKLGHLLNLLENEQECWSKYGVLSLSRRNKYYRTGENYWRGNIWMCMNYLISSALHHYKEQINTPYQKQAARMYKTLRKRLISNIYRNYKKTGYLWEQYDSRDGVGRRSHPFTGWTSLVVLLLSEKY